MADLLRREKFRQRWDVHLPALAQLRAQRQIFFMLPRQRGQRAVYGGKLPLGVRDESGLVVPDAVLPGKQPLVGCGKADGLVPGRDKGGQPRFQLVVRRQAESGLTDKDACRSTAGILS